MSFSFFNKKKEKTIIVLDIGSSSVGGAIVLIGKEAEPKILHSIRRQISIKNDVNFSRLLYLMSETLESVLLELEKVSKISPDKIFCAMSSPWCMSATHFIKIEKKIPFVVTRKMIDSIVNEEVSKIKDNSVDGENITNGIPKVVDVQNIQVKLNGYETNSPYNKKVKLVEIAIFVSISSENTVELIEDRVSRVFRGRIQFDSFSLASFIAIRDIFNESNFLFLDITGEVTDVSIIKDNVLLRNITFPVGKNFLVRRIASGFNTTTEEAESLFCMFNDGSSDNTTDSKLRKILDDAKKEWVVSIVDTLSKFSEDFSIPNSVFVTSDIVVRKWFEEIVRDEKEFEQFTLTNNQFEIKILEEKLLSKFCLFENNKIPKDLFIMLESVFAERTLSSMQ